MLKLDVRVKNTAIAAMLLTSIIGCKKDKVEPPVVIPPTTIELLTENSPWITSAVYLQVDGKISKTTNYIGDGVISSGTVSSAQYTDSSFVFVPVNPTTGAFEFPQVKPEDIQSNLNNNGYYKIIDVNGVSSREIYCTKFGYTNVRPITEISATKFTYTFVHANGNTYYVEHDPYSLAFPASTYPVAIQTQVNELFKTQNLDCK